MSKQTGFAFITAAWVVGFLFATAGCDEKHGHKQWLPEEEMHPEEATLAATAVAAPPPRTHFVATEPVGNEQTKQFLAWAQKLHYWFCAGELNADGDIVELNLHVCWPTKDEELEMISTLSQVESLFFYASGLTDDGLRHLERMPNLKKVVILGAKEVSAERFASLREARPDLELEVR